MSDTTTNLGNVISNPTARKVIYGIYALGAVAVGGGAAYFLGIGHPIPEVVTGAQAVVAYLAIPVGGLALANTSSSTPTVDPNFGTVGMNVSSEDARNANADAEAAAARAATADAPHVDAS